MLEHGESYQFSGGGDAVVIPVKILANRVDSAFNVHTCHSSHNDAKLEVAAIAFVKPTLLALAYLV